MNNSTESQLQNVRVAAPKSEEELRTSEMRNLEIVDLMRIVAYIKILIKKLFSGDVDGAISDVFDDSERLKKVAFTRFVVVAEIVTMGLLAVLLPTFIISTLASNVLEAVMGLVSLPGFTFSMPFGTGVSLVVAGFLFALATFFMRTFALRKVLDSIKVQLPTAKIVRIQALASIFNFVTYAASIAVVMISVLMSLSVKVPINILPTTVGIVLLLIVFSFSFNLLVSYIFVNKVSVAGRKPLPPFLMFYVAVTSIITLLVFWFSFSFVV